MGNIEIVKELFAERLKEILKESKKTTREVAQVVHMSAATISRYQTGEMTPKIPTVYTLAQYFKVNPDWLMGLSDVKYLTNNTTQKEHAINTIAAHLDDKNITNKKLDLITKYIDALFDDF